MSAALTDRAPRWLLLWAVLHSLAFDAATPLWQTPDEPAHVELACLLAQRGLTLRAGDEDPALQRRILESLAAADFWRQVRQSTPDPLPARFADDPFLRNAGRQVGDEASISYWLPAAICRLPLALALQVRLMRLASGFFFALATLAQWWAAAPLPRSLRLATTAAVAGLPMLAFLAGGVNNDSAATLAATLMFGCLLRSLLSLPDARRLRWGIAALLLALVAAWIKKTALFTLPLALLALAWQWGVRGTLRQRQVLLLLLAASGTLALWPSRQPAAWGGRGQPWGGGLAAQAAHDGRWGMVVRDDDVGDFGRLTQPLPAEPLRAERIHLGAWLRSPHGVQTVRLTIKDDAGLDRTTAEVGVAWRWLEVTRTVSLTTTQVLIGLAPGPGVNVTETGRLWVDGVRVLAPVNLLQNGDFETALTWGQLAAQPWREPVRRTWAAMTQTGSANGARALLYLALLFPGFWGNFGWLQVPLALSAYAALALVCLLALAGLIGELRRHPWDSAAQAAGWSLTAALLALALTAAPVIWFDWQPQGRYLLPAVAPFMLLLAVGLRFWSRRWRLARAGRWFLLGFVALDLYAFFGVLLPRYWS